jgi:tRNA dimethylallyltransferase
VRNVFYIVGPTAVGKSEIAADAAQLCNAEIVGADAFQIYEGLQLLTAKPDAETLRKVPHHLIGSVPINEEMNAARFCSLAQRSITAIHSRGKAAFVVGGSGMYVQAHTHGLSPLPPANAELRQQLTRLTSDQLLEKLQQLDPTTAATIDPHNKHRLVRAVEICTLTGRPASELRSRTPPAQPAAGVLLFRDRAELHQRIDQRVEAMFRDGVIDEVRGLGPTSATAAKTLGLHEIQELIAGRTSEAECVARIQQATRRYAKRQLTWFRNQSNFEPLNLSLHTRSAAVEWIAQKARLAFAQQG